LTNQNDITLLDLPEMNQIPIPVPEFSASIHQWQRGVLEIFEKHLVRFFLLNWHRRARKTTLLMNLLIREAFDHPNKVYAYIGPTYTQAKAIIWRDPNMLPKYIPYDLIKRRNESELFVELTNGAIIAIKGADNPDSIRGQDYEGVVLDEWALMKPMVWEEILRPIIAQNKNRWAMFAFTPKGRNFVYDYWIKADLWPDWYKSFLPVSLSKIITQDELDKAKREIPEELYNQEFECSFLADEENTLISSKSVEALRGITRYSTEIKRVIACDPSQGGDECVIYALENTGIREQKILHVKDTMAIVGEISTMMYKHKANLAAVDSIGIGAGVYDRLRELGKEVIDINSATRAGEEDRFYNLRAEMWWYAMEQIRDGKVEYPSDPELRRELSFVKYRVVNSNGRIQLEPKEETKERLGRSPDRADAFIYGLWALKYAQPVKKDGWRDYSDKKEIKSAVTSAMAA
jgi:hypothetical protein